VLDDVLECRPILLIRTGRWTFPKESAKVGCGDDSGNTHILNEFLMDGHNVLTAVFLTADFFAAGFFFAASARARSQRALVAAMIAALPALLSSSWASVLPAGLSLATQTLPGSLPTDAAALPSFAVERQQKLSYACGWVLLA
jgi:hypothetical protein